jgi:tRNA modification GTPase
MVKVNLDDTIVAISTPIGEGGIGIVRLSGKDALDIADRVFLSKDGKKPSSFKTYTVHYGHIVNGRPDHIIDEVILTVMRAPRSYTKEDVVEINCHSGIIPLKKTLELVLANGARLAEPGEFTKRAFLNGRIDITQAESVLDIIRAKTDLSLRAAANNLERRLSKEINAMRDELLDIFACIEASVDFSEEEDVDKLRKKDIVKRLIGVQKGIEKLLTSAKEGKILRQGVKTVICGSPNVGKSSLMNALLKETRSIVTHLPGTTRDTIEEVVNIKGIPIILVDTAGISRSRHPAAKEGIKRSHFSIRNADLILLILDYSRRLNKQDLDIIRHIKYRELIVVINKIDLKKRIDIGRVRKLFPTQPMAYVSALNFSGIDKLELIIQDFIFKGKAQAPDLVSLSNNRQFEALQRSLEELKGAIDSFNSKMPMDCVGVYVRSAIEQLGEITGHTITEETLDRIFAEFCIGK